MSEIKQIRYLLKGTWYKAIDYNNIPDCEAVEIKETMTQEEFKKLKQ